MRFKSLLVLMSLAVAVPIVSSPAAAGERARAGVKRPLILVSSPKALKNAEMIAGKPAAVLDFNISPKQTKIYVNGEYRGVVGWFDGYPAKLRVEPGEHRIRLVTPDGRTVARTVQTPAGTETDLDLDLRG